MSAPVILSSGAIEKAFHNETVFEPILQVLDVKVLQPKKPEPVPRHRMTISDGQHSMIGILCAAHNHLVQAKAILPNSFIRVKEYIPQNFPDTGQKVVVILSVEPLDVKHDQRIGNPKPLDPIKQYPTAVPSATGVQSYGADQKQKFSAASGFGGHQTAAISGSTSNGGYQYKAPSVQPATMGIHGLNPYTAPHSALKLRVVTRSEIRHLNRKTDNNPFELFEAELIDTQGQMIRAVAMGQFVSRFYPLLPPGACVIISRAELAEEKATPYKRQLSGHELRLKASAEVHATTDDGSLPREPNTFVKIAEIAFAEPGTFIDTIGVVTKVESLGEVTSKKTGQPLQKRTVQIRDETKQIELSLWGSLAVETTEDQLPVGTVVTVKSARVSAFAGRSISVGFGGSFEIDNKRDVAINLCNWWITLPPAAKNRIDTLTQNGGSGPLMTIHQIKESGLGFGSKPDAVAVRVHIQNIKFDPEKLPWYFACTNSLRDEKSPRERICNKRVAQEGNGVVCGRCGPIDKYEMRYVLSMQVNDETGQMWVTAFDDVAKIILGVSAKELSIQIDKGQVDEVQNLFIEKRSQAWELQLRVHAQLNQQSKEEAGGVEGGNIPLTPENSILRLTVVGANPTDFQRASGDLLSRIEAATDGIATTAAGGGGQ